MAVALPQTHPPPPKKNPPPNLEIHSGTPVIVLGGKRCLGDFLIYSSCKSVRNKQKQTGRQRTVCVFHVRRGKKQTTEGDLYANSCRAGAGFISYRKLVINLGKVQADLQMNGYCRIRKNFLKRLLQRSLVFLKSWVSQIVWRTHTSNQPVIREEKPVA